MLFYVMYVSTNITLYVSLSDSTATPGCSSGHESLLKMNFIPKFAEFNREEDDFKIFGKSLIVLT